MPWSIEFFRHDAGAESRQLLQRRTIPPLTPSVVGNTTFTLAGHADARVVALAGTFNGWDSQHVLFGKENGVWICRVDLPPGKFFYQFVVDDQWITDPGNTQVEDAGTGSLASVIEKKP
jgi:1,4-alpha-glucan branching enzyme